MVIDAHAHLQMQEFAKVDLTRYFERIGKVVVNGTSPQDWSLVAELAEGYPTKVLPSFGVHPWEVKSLEVGWRDDLGQYLEQFPQAGVGEVGLDKWVKGYDLSLQKEVFLAQLEVAQELRRPLTVHCLKAWGSLVEILESFGEGRYLLHAYSGPAEMVNRFVELGCYFSFSPYFMFERKSAAREVFRHIPRERILVETDAPSMLGPEISWGAEQGEMSGNEQHPGNIWKAYTCLAEVLDVDQVDLQRLVQENFMRWC